MTSTLIPDTRSTRGNATGADRAARILGDPRWALLTTRSGAADGAFFYSVRSTGVYCRPSCAARTPRPENVAFYASREDAEHAGFRACKRCRPDRPERARRRTGNYGAADGTSA